MKFLSYVLVAALAFAAAFAITSSSDIPSSKLDLTDADSSIMEQESTKYETYYSQLTDYQKSIYNVLLPAIRNAEKKIKISDVDITAFKRDCLRVVTAIHYDHPEYFWFRGGYSFDYSRIRFRQNADIEFEPMYYDYATSFFNAEDKYNKLMSAVKNIADLAKAHSSDGYDQIVYVHDYLIENAIYDHDGLEEYYKTSHSPSCEYIFSAYGCLVDKKTVCSGYAKAFQLIMRELGYDCSYITGEAGEPHGWNCIYLDGEGYYVDITWDDPDYEKETPLYNYAFITSEALLRTHKLDLEFETPVCNAKEYNYFVHEGFYDEEYDFKTASSILSAQADRSSAHIQFGSLSELGRAFNELIENNKFRQIPGVNNFKQYVYNEEHYTLTLIK